MKQIKQIDAKISDVPKSFWIPAPTKKATSIKPSGNNTHLINLSL